MLLPARGVIPESPPVTPALQPAGHFEAISTVAQHSALETVPASGFGQVDFLSLITGWSNDPWHCGVQGVPHLPQLDTTTAPHSYIGLTNAQFGFSDGGNTSYDGSLLPPAIHNPPPHPACSYIADYMADPHGDLGSTSALTYTAPLSVKNSTGIRSNLSNESPSVRDHARPKGSQIALRTILPAPSEGQLLERHEASQQKPFPCPMCPAGYKRRTALNRHYKSQHDPHAKPGRGGRPRNSSRLL
ncbi:hypothetical protein BJX65DRAFT_194286 [Aspergillus insuetus]